MFWSLFFQNGAALTLWAKHCTRRPAWLQPETFLVVNPGCIVLLSSAAAWFWRRMGERGKEPSTPDKILLGLFTAFLACLVMVAASYAGGDGCSHDGSGGTLVSMGWLIAMYATISLAEILVSPMGLSYCTQVAPKRLGGLVMGLWFVSLSVGYYLSGLMSSRLWDTLPHSTYFGILAGCMLGVSVLLLLVRGILKTAVPAA
jgi:POT family proton-dependent oligopeptide transporter